MGQELLWRLSFKISLAMYRWWWLGKVFEFLRNAKMGGKEALGSRLVFSPNGTHLYTFKASSKNTPAGDQGLPKVKAVKAIEHLPLLLHVLLRQQIPGEPEEAG